LIAISPDDRRGAWCGNVGVTAPKQALGIESGLQGNQIRAQLTDVIGNVFSLATTF
jgi:hypothetical protein